ncbi:MULTISPECIES: putative T7SS-secreted protein [Prauserella salsuginis group]|uniref:Uncharacterized protein YukE n=2 Tax=Prauserella salsuginis group TaxID=2893672 RepID=A0A839XJM6_9PSEU|nr:MULTISPECIES: hypothetical protein [Prauserella salsuginis group]MBB3663500.1 uncharacterized protein YukE [Prauserella sediminis]MCR3720680.1 hypothetical protein [Prauserella flava]MCR3735239.1 hypothetical protein [Prauserella salsuginis]
MAELGSTEDPKELIPGDAETITGAANTLRARAKKFSEVASGLGNVRIENWYGAASNQFWDTFTAEKPKWEKGASALRSTATTLDGHAQTVSWAQSQAAEAIAKYKEGQRATATAQQNYTDQHGVSPNAPGAPATAGSFTDPGEAKRQEAQEILDRARKQLQTVGGENANAIRKQGGHSPDAPGWLTGPADFASTSPQIKGNVNTDSMASKTLMDQAREDGGRWNDRFDRYQQHGHQFDTPERRGPNVDVTVAQSTASYDLVKAQASGATQLGDATASGSASAKIGADASAAGGFTRDGLKGTVKASAGATAEAKGQVNYGAAEVGGSGKAFAGAEAQGTAELGADGLKAGANAFAGARAEGEVHADVGGVGAGAKGEAWAGIGAEADVQVGMDDGKFVVGGEVGAALGVGGKLGGEITVDPGKITDTAQDAGAAVGDFAGGVGDKARDIGGTLNPFD